MARILPEPQVMSSRGHRRETFEGRSTFCAWLYRIAANDSLDLLARRRPEPATGGEVP